MTSDIPPKVDINDTIFEINSDTYNNSFELITRYLKEKYSSIWNDEMIEKYFGYLKNFDKCFEEYNDNNKQQDYDEDDDNFKSKYKFVSINIQLEYNNKYHNKHQFLQVFNLINFLIISNIVYSCNLSDKLNFII